MLAAGAGRRMGGPKALLRITPDQPTLVERAVATAGGCDGATVVVGAAGDEVEVLVRSLGRDVDIAHVSTGTRASVPRCEYLAGLAAATHEGGGVTEAVLITLVDLTDLTAEVVARVLDDPGPGPARRATGERSLRRAAYRGVPGHPALIGRATGRRSPTRPAATRARAATSAPTRTTSSSAATSRRAATPTPAGTASPASPPAPAP